MEQIVSFCDNTIEETAIKINNTESILKRQPEKKEIKKTITSTEAAAKKILPQRKFKKYNSLKYKPKPTAEVKEIAKETGNTKNRTYAEVLGAGRNLTARLSKSNNANYKQKQNIHEKLCSKSPANRFRR